MYAGLILWWRVRWWRGGPKLHVFSHALCRGPVSMKWRGGFRKARGSLSSQGLCWGLASLFSLYCMCGVVMCEPVRVCVCATPIVGCGVLYACMWIGVCNVRSMRGYAASAWSVLSLQYARVCCGLCCA